MSYSGSPETGAPSGPGPEEEQGEAGRRRTRRNLIGTLRENNLTRVGYSPSKKASTRRRALASAVKKQGKVSTLRKINAVAVLTKRREPKLSKTQKSDVRYLQKKYFAKK